MNSLIRFLTAAAIAIPALAQLPPSSKLSAADQQGLHGELDRLQGVLRSAAEKPAVTYQIARTWAYGQQWPETVEWLNKAVSFRAGIDPSRDSLFGPLRGTREFDAILRDVQSATAPVSHSRRTFSVAEGDLVPESMAYDPSGKSFYFGSMKKGKVVRCSSTGDCRDFATGLGTVLGLKVSRGGLWLVNNLPERSELLHYDLASSTVTGRYPVSGAGHEFNDLVIAPSGDVYLTDTPADSVWHLAPGAADLAKLAPPFQFANGIALSADSALLYVSTFPGGVEVMDLRTGAAAPLARPDGLYLANIDGLYFHRGALIAIQNGFMSPRVVRLTLARDLRSVTRLEVLERRNPLFNGVTTGVLAGRDFFYMANIQDDKQSGFEPIQILKIRLASAP